jgi:hypothetical protein
VDVARSDIGRGIGPQTVILVMTQLIEEPRRRIRLAPLFKSYLVVF